MIVKIVFLVSTVSAVSSMPGGLLHVSTVSYGILLPFSPLASAATLVNIRNATSCPHPPPKNGVTNIATLGMGVLFKRTPTFLLLMHATIQAPTWAADTAVAAFGSASAPPTPKLLPSPMSIAVLDTSYESCLCVREADLVMLVQLWTVKTNGSCVLKWSCWAEVLVFHYTFVCSITIRRGCCK